MNTSVLPRAAGVQLLLVGVLFAVLALTVPHSFFRDHGAVVGPLAWIACSLVTGRVLRLSIARTALAAMTGGLVAGAVGVVVEHVVSLPVAIAVFAAVCAAEPRRRAPTPSESAAERA
jgi:uncharacterized membrane protein